MTLEKIGKTGSPPFLQLEGSIGVSGDLGELKTGSKYRKETINTIKTNLSNWMRNDRFKPFRESQIDLAIVIKLSVVMQIKPVFILEFIALLAFGYSWITKSDWNIKFLRDKLPET